MVGLMNNFNMTAEETIQIADMLYKATAISGIGMEDLGYTLKYVQGTARITNQSLEDMLETVALLGRLNMRGQNVGTGLSTGLINISAPAPEAIEELAKLGFNPKVFQTAEGSLQPIEEIMHRMVDLTADMTDIERTGFLENIIGKDAIDVWSTLLEAYRTNIDLVKLNKDEFGNWAGAAGDAADVMNDTVTGALERLWGAITNITTSKFMTERGPIQDWLDGITERIQKFDLNGWLEDHRTEIESLVASGQKFWDFGVKFLAVFIAMNAEMAPTLIPVLETFGDVLETLASNSAVLVPLVTALTAMWVAAKLAALAGALTVPVPGGGGMPVPGGGGGRGGGPGLPTPIPMGGWRTLSMGARFGIAGLVVGTTVVASNMASDKFEEMTGYSIKDSELGSKGLAELVHDQMNRDSNPVTYPGRKWGARGGFGAPSNAFTPRPDFVEQEAMFAGPHRQTPSKYLPAGYGGAPAPIHVHVEIDGSEIASATVRDWQDRVARR
jgi:TP901 family phage tail tape measure protein